jgi:Fe-S oxidoreductase
MMKKETLLETLEIKMPFDARRELIIWVDSFNNYFHTDVFLALQSSLQVLGFKVRFPPKSFCGGGAHFEFIAKMHDDIVKGTPVLFSEPSSLLAFKHELLRLFPHDLDAKRLSQQVFTLAQFLENEGIEMDLPRPEPKLKNPSPLLSQTKRLELQTQTGLKG